MTNKFRPVYRIENSSILAAEEEPIDFDVNVGEMILEAFKCKPDFIGQIDADTQQKTTFQQMRKRSIKCALWLKRKGISAKNVVAICARNSTDVYVPFLACLYINAIAYIWNNVSFDRKEPLALLRRTSPDIIFIQDCYVPQIRKAIKMLPKYVELLSKKKVVIFGETEEFTSLKSILYKTVSEKEIDKFSCTKCNLQDTAMIMYTTSTLDYLEEIRFSYISFISPSNQFPPKMHFGDIGLWREPFCWTYSPFLTVRAILSYVTVIKTLTEMCDMEVICQLIEKYKVTWVFLKYGISLQIEKIDHIVKKYNISSLKQFVYDCPNIKHGDIISEHTKYLSKVVCIRVYGTAETGVIATNLSMDGISEYVDIFRYLNKNIKLMVIDLVTRRASRPWCFGEIWCKSPCVVSTNIASRNRKNVIGLDNRDGWFCTRDYGFFMEDGTVLVVDKLNHSSQLIVFNSRIHLFEVYFQALLLEKYQNVLSNVVALSHCSRFFNQMPEIFVWTKPGRKVTEEELRETIKQKYFFLEKYIVIRIVVDDLPLYPNGEINRRKVKSIEYLRDHKPKQNCELCRSSQRKCLT